MPGSSLSACGEDIRSGAQSQDRRGCREPLSGAVLLFPAVLPEKLRGKPGAWWVATIHYLSSAVLILFLIGHLYLATTGDRIGDLIRAMITGRHKRHDPEEDG
jgi:hypothetical protein